jgi:peptidyl-dipeptidase A
MRNHSRQMTGVLAVGVLAVGLIIAFAVRAAPPTSADAVAFLARVEAQLAADSEYSNRAGWVQETYITSDTSWLVAKVNAATTDRLVSFAKEAIRFDHVPVDEVSARKLYLLKQALVMPASSRPGASQELSDIQARLDTDYSTAKFNYQDRLLTLDDMEEILRTSRNPDETRTLWEGWRAVASPQMTIDYARLIALANEGARELGYADTGVLWRSWYDMPPQAFAAKVDALWAQTAPLYAKLHCFVRARLSRQYGVAVQPATGPIRADLLGNMWSQSWGNVYDVVAPKGMSLGYDVTAALQSHGYDAVKIVHTADHWYQSIGFAPLPATFWERSLFTRPRDREVVCHPSAWDIDNKEDLRLKGCLTVTADDFYTAHHELGHLMYQRAYAAHSILFASGANDGFHEAIGDFAALNALTPTYLKELGLIDNVPGPESDIPYLLRMALDKIAIIPFAIIVDKWRWGVFAGQITPEHYNDAWWDLVSRYQNLMPPGPRSADAFDPGAKFHVADSTPYARYFLADLYEFQFYRDACRLAGWKGPLNRCSIYGDKNVGAKFAAMLQLGQSKPWPEALASFGGERDIDAAAIIEYFAPLSAWLDRQNRGQSCKK